MKKVKKFKRRFNSRLIRRNCTYSIQEISSLYSIHANTVNVWFKSGLKKIDGKKPFLVFGMDLADFINEKNVKAKKSSAPDEMYCCKCKAPRKVLKNIVDIKIINSKRLMIKGVCAKCGIQINKLGAVQKLEEYKKIFKTLSIHNEHLLGCVNTSANID